MKLTATQLKKIIAEEVSRPRRAPHTEGQPPTGSQQPDTKRHQTKHGLNPQHIREPQRTPPWGLRTRALRRPNATHLPRQEPPRRPPRRRRRTPPPRRLQRVPPRAPRTLLNHTTTHPPADTTLLHPPEAMCCSGRQLVDTYVITGYNRVSFFGEPQKGPWATMAAAFLC